MRFGIPELEESDFDVDVAVDPFASDEDESDHAAPDLQRRRKSQLAQNIADFLASSDSEDGLDSEDEVGDLLDEVVGPSRVHWREPKKEKAKVRVPPPTAPRLTRTSVSLSSSGPSWRRWEPSVVELLREESSQYSQWVKNVEAEAWREGHRVAGERRSRLKDIEQRTRAELKASRAGKRDAEAEELQRLMEGLVVRHKKEEENTAKLFADREAKLWADVDAAIREAERRAVEEQTQRLAAARKQKEEEAARIAAEEQAALQRKTEAEKQAKEKAQKEAAEQAERARQEAEARQSEEEAKAQEEKQKAAAAEGSRGPTEWNKWVVLQRGVKESFIEPGKRHGLKKNFRQRMRMITRGLGQVVNTQESIVRVTNDIHGHLSSELPSPPSASSPVTKDGIAMHYGYILSQTCKAFIKQAEAEVSAKPDAAFPLARIVLGLMIRGHAVFGNLLFARMVKKCPWVIPHYPQRQEGQSREEYEKSTGRALDESTTEYISRMAGIASLYFAILQTPIAPIVETSGQRPTPQELLVLVEPVMRLPSAWTWMASILRPTMARMPPTAHLLNVFIDIVGAELLARYGPKQVSKALAALARGLEAGSVKSDMPATLEVLKLKLEKFKTSGRLEPHKAREWS